MADTWQDVEEAQRNFVAENARLRGEVEEVRSALLRYYEMSRTRPESVSTADIAHMARKEVEALRIMVDQFLSERDMALADRARVEAESAREITRLGVELSEAKRVIFGPAHERINALEADLARVTAERDGLRERIDAVREQMPRGESCFACRGALSVLAACAPPASGEVKP